MPSQFLTGAAVAGGLAVINSIGNIAGFTAPYLTGILTDSSGSVLRALWVLAGVMVAAAGLIVVMGTILGRPNGEPTKAKPAVRLNTK
jgi:nitrate/nitrite transporter NarK